MKKQTLIYLMLTAVLFGCNTAYKASVTATSEQKLVDVAYGPHQRNIMDVYLPANRNAQTPFVLLIHGGGWTGYGKEYIREYQDSMFAHGIAVASINHRYANDSTVHYTQMLEDIDNAINYCWAHASEWHIRKDQIVMTGVSSGAHLALLYSYTTNKKVSAIVDFCGPTNLADTSLISYEIKTGLIAIIQKMAGKIYQVGQPLDAAFSQSSPINYVKKIPTLLIHGDADIVVPYTQSLQLTQKLEQQNIPHKLITIKGANHDLNIKNDPATRALVYDEAVRWILKYGK